ncbi:wax ester/triacylglycerol synthase domain-containing protein [Mycobacterium heidelbergense]|uniref:wax ester/triacylglycerol synthase domain-containing protein n=1 Tax=Mycobacterium heidelbergense TaxID=53376 RepID=UPI003CF5E801
MDNVLDPLDQLTFDAERATGVVSMPHPFWVYDRPIDIDGLRKFHHHLQQGWLPRRIEPSRLRFGRHRWVSAGGFSDIEIATPRPRAELDAWLEEQASAPVDAEHGPPWHLGVLPFTDGGAAVSLVVSHCLADGVGLLNAMADAADGRDNPSSWPAAGSRRRWRAVRQDAHQTVRDIPAFGRALAAAVRLARRARRKGSAAAPATTPLRLPTSADESFTPPMATIFIDADEWEARAHALGGTSNALLVGVASHLAQRIGRVTADGSVLMKLPVNERTAGDTRANAVSHLTVTVDPAPATTDLREVRAAIKQALIDHHEMRDDERAVMSFVPLLRLLPKRLARLVDNTVVSSNLGAIDPAVVRPDGTSAGLWASRVSHRGVTKTLMHRLGGVLYVLSGIAQGQVFISVSVYQPGYANSNEALRQDLSEVLNDFSLAGTYIGAPPYGAAYHEPA